MSWRKEKRHPTIGDHVVVGAGAKVLGPITVGEHSRIGANSVVVKDVPPHSVVVGVPGRMRRRVGDLVEDKSHEDLQHNILHDVTMEMLQDMSRRIAALESMADQDGQAFDVQMDVEVNAYRGPWGI